MQPTPFEIVDGSDGMRIASNGLQRLILLADIDGKLFKRRGVSGLSFKTPAETLIPQLNELTGEMLQNPEMTAEQAVHRLLAIAGTVPTQEPVNKEWAVAQVGDTMIYVDGQNVVVTKQNIVP